MGINEWFADPDNWSGAGSIPVQLGYHLGYSLVVLLIAFAIAFPIGIAVGHTGRGEGIVVGVANAMRALPTLGLLILMVQLMAPRIHSNLAYVIPALVVLVLLAIPPILAGTVTGIRGIDRQTTDAARGIGCTDLQIVTRVEVPCAMPQVLAGVRSATLQVVATATVMAYVSLQGLGRYIIDGRAVGNYAEMAGGAILVALLALVLELFFSIAQGRLISPGLSRRETRRTGAPAPVPA
jgi:ABC-type proline/glycine betaine transport systems, permease component